MSDVCVHALKVPSSIPAANPLEFRRRLRFHWIPESAVLRQWGFTFDPPSHMLSIYLGRRTAIWSWWMEIVQ